MNPGAVNEVQMNQIINPADTFRGTITVPGDKSISHRSLILGAVAEGETRISNLLQSEDVKRTRQIFSQLGVTILDDNDTVVIQSSGPASWHVPEEILDAGNSGTTMRLMTGVLAAQPFSCTLTGDASLCKRPMNRIIQPLEKMGAEITAQNGGLAPLKITGKKLKSIEYTSPVASAQIKSCLLLAGLFANGRTSVREPSISRNHTERMLPCFGVPVEIDQLEVAVKGPAKLKAADIEVPGDISSAAFFMAAAAILPGSECTICNVGINPTRIGIINILQEMGTSITIANPSIENGEPRADIIIHGRSLKGTLIDGPVIPSIIDEIPILAIAATMAEGETVVKDARELRFKETDRINAVTQNLQKMGIKLRVQEDGFVIKGPQKPKSAEIHSFGDHRIAMAFAVAGLVAEGETLIHDVDCVDTSFPGFFEKLKAVSYD